MRRLAVVLALSLACAGLGACRSHLYVPADGTDGGSGGAPATGGATVTGGAGGSQDGTGGSGGFVSSSGGSFGTGGRLGGTGGRSPGTGGTTGMCSGQRIELEYIIRRANVVLTVGRNASMGSMSPPFGNGSRMAAVQQAVRTAVIANQKAVNFAYQDFPDAQACNNGSSCCVSSAIFPSLKNSSVIEQELNSCDFGGSATSACVSPSMSRPITDALRNVLTPPPGRMPILGPIENTDRRLILMVDGGPGCYGEDPIQACDNARAQVAQLSNTVQVHVLPIGEEAEWSTPCLASLSLQGDRAATPNQPFPHRARDPMELTRSLNEIVGDAAEAACEITLLQVPTEGRNVSLDIRRQTVPEDPTGTNGWRFTKSRGTIELFGFWCNEIQQAENLDINVWQCQ